jgi:hypothetical protein
LNFSLSSTIIVEEAMAKLMTKFGYVNETTLRRGMEGLKSNINLCY